ncbi:MAG: tRNA (adenosine(37)-N6)-threonylcarbamoyltransferase complex dimerization subunit type 1 TsaB [Pseudomonadota bacterium]|nr:tRNA (adenosine(37)-N6)-threonylcarbamoyltransferase complex dimerization subunit type 1 TsaB [Pseudomonadota bacterium]
MNLLAFDTSTEHLSAAVQRGDARFVYEGAGGAQSSATLIPALMGLLAQAQLALGDVQAIVFGRGPGSFTGLRTACAVAQGLAFGARARSGASADDALPVLPLDTLLAVAEAARLSHGSTRVLAWLDARMGEVYAAAYEWTGDAWHTHAAPFVCPPAALALPGSAAQADGWALAGNAFAAYGEQLSPALAALPRIDALPSAAALLSLAPAPLAAGRAVPAAQALPLYIRDKVALTTAERLAQGGVR